VDGVLRVAEFAEESGFDSVWATEHLLMAEEQADPYGTVLEPLSCLSWLAGRLERVELGTSVVLAPLHHPVHLAKVAATLQQISRGRLKLGIGAGWHEPEFRFLGQDFADRGRRTDEALRLMRALWDGQSRFEGEYWSFEGARFGPLPESAPEIWVGGGSARGLHRARELGDVWHPLGLTSEEVRRAKQDWPEGRVVPRYELRLTEDGERSASSMKLSGSPSEVAERIRELAGAGADGVVLSAGLDPETAVATLRRFANEAAPRLLGE
jgi:probable F420-dependent oxidoreductase